MPPCVHYQLGVHQSVSLGLCNFSFFIGRKNCKVAELRLTALQNIDLDFSACFKPHEILHRGQEHHFKEKQTVSKHPCHLKYGVWGKQQLHICQVCFFSSQYVKWHQNLLNKIKFVCVYIHDRSKLHHLRKEDTAVDSHASVRPVC
jgi:hypothetical protein